MFRKGPCRIEWGQPTRSKEGEQRRAVVSGLPVTTNRQMIEAFFGAQVIEGATLTYPNNSCVAFVQFKRPVDFTNATLRNSEYFLNTNRRANIRPYMSVDEPKSRRKRQRSRSPSREGGPSSSRQCSGQRKETARGSDYRDLDRSNGHNRHSFPLEQRRRDSRSDKNDNLSVNQSVEDNPNSLWRDSNLTLNNELIQRRIESKSQALPPNSHAFGTPSLSMAGPICLPTSHSYVPSPTYGSMTAHTTTTTTMCIPFAQQANVDTMPRDIRLILELVITQGSPRTLSDYQFKQILEYFETERNIRLKRISNHEPQSTLALVAPANDQENQEEAEEEQASNSDDDDESTDDNGQASCDIRTIAQQFEALRDM